MVIILILLVTVVGITSVSLVPGWFTTASHTVLRPFLAAGGWTEDQVSDVGAYFMSKQELVRENKELRDRVARQQLALQEVAILREENERYREMWERGTSSEGVLASVLTTPPRSPYDLIVLDVGRSQDIEANDRIVKSGVALGRIRSVYAQSAVAELYSTNGVQTPGHLVGKDMSVTLTGDNNGVFRTRIPKDIAVEKGDQIVVPGIRRLRLATVVQVSSSATDPEQRIRAKTPLNMASLRFVRVIRQPASHYSSDDSI